MIFMNKVIVAIDGLKYSQSAVSHAVQIAHGKSIHLVGVFLDDFSRNSFGVVDITSHEGSFESYYRELRHKDEEERRHATAVFEQACKKAHIPFTIHHDKDIAQQELLTESVYADLLIIDKTQTFSRYEQQPPSPFLQDLLAGAHCPVLLVPEHYRPVEKVVFLYDGSPSSVFAFKAFHQLLPMLVIKEVSVLTVQPDDKALPAHEKELMKELVGLEYTNANFVTLHGDAAFEITNYLSRQKKEVLVVLGAYDRGRLSRWARTSMADVLLNNLQVPIFVAHNK